MTYIIDTRASGGEALFLGRHLILPVSTDPDVNVRQGALRYNPAAKCLQIAVDTDETSNPVEWASLSPPPTDSFTGAGGQMHGDIEMVDGARLLLSIGSATNPSLSFMADNKTGMAMLTMGSLSFIANSNVIANISSTGLTVSGNAVADVGSFGTLVSPNASLMALQSDMANLGIVEIDDLTANAAQITSLTTPTFSANSAQIWSGSVRTLTSNTITANVATIGNLITPLITAESGVFHEFSVVPDAGGVAVPSILFGESPENDWVISLLSEKLNFSYQESVVAMLTPTGLESSRLRAISGIEFGVGFALGTPSLETATLTYNDGVLASFEASGLASFMALDTSTLAVSGSVVAHDFLSDDQNYDQGTVMSLGGTAEVTACTTDADTAIIGVVAHNASIKLRSAIEVPETVFIASTGRATCKAVAPVVPGDLLMGSVTPGFAVVAPPGTSDAAILGKAITGLASGNGTITIFMK